METTRTDRFKTAILLIAATGLIAGLAFYFSGEPDVADIKRFILCNAGASRAAPSLGPSTAIAGNRP